jgi:glycine cleavage system regulatory protein
VFEEVAVVKKLADSIGIAKVHPQSDAGILESPAVPIRDIDGVSKKGFVYRLAAIINEHEVQLMNVECVKFTRSVLDDPVFHRPLLHNNVRNA